MTTNQIRNNNTVARALVYVGIAFSLFMTAEGIAHVSGRNAASLTTPAIASTTTATAAGEQRITPAATDLGNVSYLPAQIRVQSTEEAWDQPEMAPTF